MHCIRILKFRYSFFNITSFRVPIAIEIPFQFFYIISCPDYSFSIYEYELCRLLFREFSRLLSRTTLNGVLQLRSCPFWSGPCFRVCVGSGPCFRVCVGFGPCFRVCVGSGPVRSRPFREIGSAQISSTVEC